MKKVLVVDDDLEFQKMLRTLLKNKAEIICAHSIREAEKKFTDNYDIGVIVMDDCVPGKMLNTEELVRKFRRTFLGPMLANSNVPDFRKKLIVAGCDCECNNSSMPSKLCEILGVPWP